MGSFIGSFLNVVIYRVPRNMSVNEPKRSFCPTCKKPIPWFRNIPIFTWIAQGGKCAECKSSIPFRYVFVEILTGLLFLACWLLIGKTAPIAAAAAMIFCAFLVVISYIDAEHMFIFPMQTYVGSAIGLAAAYFAPQLVELSVNAAEPAWKSLLRGVFGWIAGFGGLWLVVIFGKMAFGKKKIDFEQLTPWKLIEPANDDEDLRLSVEGEEVNWCDMFVRPTDRLIIQGSELRVSGELVKAGEVVISKDAIEANGQKWSLSDIKSLDGDAKKIVIPREAMGMGDPPLFGMIGAFLGWQSLLFVLFASCITAIFGGLLARVGFGRHFPYGPYLAVGALVWMLGGWKIWSIYVQSVGL